MSRPNLSRKAKNLSLAAVAGLAGFASIVIAFTALLLGIWLDSLFFDERGVFTVSLLILSIPVSLYTMLKLVMGAVKRIVPQPPHNPSHHVPDVEEDSF